MSIVINRIEASSLFVAVKKLGIEDKLSMGFACMAMKQKVDRYMKKVWENHGIIAAALLDPYQKSSMLDESDGYYVACKPITLSSFVYIH